MQFAEPYRRFLATVGTFVSLAAVIDGFSRRVLAWPLSITMDVSFCIEALEEVLSMNEKPEIFNTDQRSQFTSEAFTARLKKNGIAISMDGKGRWRDNLFVERLWRSVKYEEVYLRAWPDPRFPHRTEYDFRIQEGAERCRGASTRKRR